MIEVETTMGEEIWSNGEASTGEGTTREEPGPVGVNHVVDFYNRYPGEVVTFFTRIEVREPVSDLFLRISLPRGLTLDHYRPPPALDGSMPALEVGHDTNELVWSLEGDAPAGASYEYQTEARVSHTEQDMSLESRAAVATVLATPSSQTILAEETVTLAVRARGGYLRHLPAFYEQDELMGRFLMLFESFWAPIEMQIDSMPSYFDPRITPKTFLPWLASWLDLELDENWPEKRLRRLIRWAIALHRSRGTKWGLLKYLEIYTGQKAEIIERRARDFVLGPAARLGPGIALGRGNRPHTFAVNLRLPPIDTEDKAERARQEKIRRRTIEAIIDMQKPAHTVYTLHLESLSAAELETQAEKAKAKTAAAEAVDDEIAAQAAIWFKLDDEPSPQKGEKQSKKDKSAGKKRKSTKRRGKKS